MKKIVVLILSLITTCAYAEAAQNIYCPTEVICKGSPDTCYVDLPKNFDNNFIYDSNHLGIHVKDPNGRYKFFGAKYGNGEGFCELHYVGGSTDPHASSVIFFENKIRLQPNRHQSNHFWHQDGNLIYCNNSDDPSVCPFITKP